MRWSVTGADSTTGREQTIELDAPDAQEAEARANYGGLLVSSVRPLDPPAPTRGPGGRGLDYRSPGAGNPPPPPTVQGAAAAPGEQTFYSGDGVVVTDLRVIVFGKTYAMANVASVERRAVPPDRSSAIVAVLSGLVVAAIGAAIAFGAGALLPGWLILLGGLVLAGLSLRVAVTAKWAYVVRLSSTSGEVDAYTHSDGSRIEAIVAAVNDAIIARGMHARA